MFWIVLVLSALLWLLAQRINRRAMQACPPQAPLQKNGQVHWHAVQMGPAEPRQALTVLLVHGIAGNLRHFQMNMQTALAQTHKVIAIDRPGSGYSTSERPLSLLEQATALHAWLDQQGVGPVLIVGHSLGGAIALAMAQARPERVAGLSLIAPFTAPITTPPAVFLPLALVPRPLYKLLAHTALPVMARWMRGPNLRFVFSPVSVTEGFVTQGGGYLSERPSQLFATLHDMRYAEQDIPHIHAQYPNMHLPVQVLYDTTDRVLDAQVHGAQLAQRLPTAQVSFIKDGGHMLPITQSQHCVDWVRQQLLQIESAAHASH